MNVDEAKTLSQFSKAMTLSKLDLAEVAEVLAKEVQRLRAELADTENARDSWRRVCEKETEAKHQAWAELAEAKAAYAAGRDAVQREKEEWSKAVNKRWIETRTLRGEE